MEALKAASVIGGDNPSDSVLASTTRLVRKAAIVLRRLNTPGVQPLASQIASKETLERFELMLQCGF
jgi:hypothetical protein